MNKTNRKRKSNASAKPERPLDLVQTYPCTDLGNAERFAAQHRGRVMFDIGKKCWRVWDGKRWVVDGDLSVLKLAAKTARSILNEAIDAPAPTSKGDTDLRKRLFDWALKSESREKLSAMVEVGKSQDCMAMDAESFDHDPMFFNCSNGVINLRTGNLTRHDNGDFMTKLSSVEYIPEAQCPRWERFLHDATGGDKDFIRFLQVLAGYTLTGSTIEEKLFLLCGPEASGKTTFLETLRGILGDYSCTIDPAMLTKPSYTRQSGSASPELARLRGARLVIGSELEGGRELAEALAKSLTGGETITARHLYGECFDFLPQFKIMLALNQCPKCNADDGALWRRMERIGFDKTVPVEKRDKTLKPYLRDPRGGATAVLAWAVEGCQIWQREGLVIPEAVKRSTDNYRNESDPIHNFFEDRLSFNPMGWMPWVEIWMAYQEYAESQGVPERYRVAPARITDRLKSKGCEAQKKHSGRGWQGVEIR